MNAMLEEIINYLEISPAVGTAGQPTRQQFAEICAAGYEVVINLATSTSWDAVADEPELTRALGMQHIAIPVDWEAPTTHDLEQFFAAMDGCKGRKVFVHCARNMRVSCFIYLYRVLKLGWSPEAALPDLLKIWQPDGTWQIFINA
jgi:protein tyrosine phosphatase (PTP) superfamily phosphohydrolase (DUF442 family)